MCTRPLTIQIIFLLGSALSLGQQGLTTNENMEDKLAPQIQTSKGHSWHFFAPFKDGLSRNSANLAHLSAWISTNKFEEQIRSHLQFECGAVSVIMHQRASVHALLKEEVRYGSSAHWLLIFTTLAASWQPSIQDYVRGASGPRSPSTW